MVTAFAQAVFRTLVRECGVPSGSTIVVAASGGPDSTALVSALDELRALHSLRLVLAHLDHRLRAESVEDAAFVRSLASTLRLEHRESALPWDDPALRPRSNVEAAARAARLEFLGGVAREVGGIVAVGHTADDVLETMLAQLLRGAGPRGLSHPRARRADGLVRPLLERTRSDVIEYLRGRGLTYRFDPTNTDGSNLRARLRRDVVPLLRRENPEIARVAARTSRLVGALEDAAVDEARRVLAALVKVERPGEIILDAPSGRPYHRSTLSTVLREAAERLLGRPLGDGFEALFAAASAWGGGGARAVELPGGVRIEVGPIEVRVLRRGGSRAASESAPLEKELSIPGSLVWSPFANEPSRLATTLNGTIADAPGDPSRCSGPRVAWLDLERLALPVRVRRRVPGDRYRPLGLDGTAKVHDLLIDRKIPREVRDALPVVADREGIVWIPGLRVDERARITDRTARAWRVEAVAAFLPSKRVDR